MSGELELKALEARARPRGEPQGHDKPGLIPRVPSRLLLLQTEGGAPFSPGGLLRMGADETDWWSPCSSCVRHTCMRKQAATLAQALRRRPPPSTLLGCSSPEPRPSGPGTEDQLPVLRGEGQGPPGGVLPPTISDQACWTSAKGGGILSAVPLPPNTGVRAPRQRGGQLEWTSSNTVWRSTAEELLSPGLPGN